MEDKIEKELNLEELKKELESCAKTRDEYLAGWQRAQADFLNYKKDQSKTLEELMKFANLDLIVRLLPVLENFDLIEKRLPEGLKQDENVKGILQIKTQILDFLRSQGIEEIKVAIDQKPDLNYHEIIEEIEQKEGESGMIFEEVQRGYTIHGKVIKPAKVKVIK